jgi:hypothetical protein
MDISYKNGEIKYIYGRNNITELKHGCNKEFLERCKVGDCNEGKN